MLMFVFLIVCHYLADMRCKPYWMLYGLDQLLHQYDESGDS